MRKGAGDARAFRLLWSRGAAHSSNSLVALDCPHFVYSQAVDA